jgi:hypothetical protein
MTSYVSLLNAVTVLLNVDSQARLRAVQSLINNALIRDEISKRAVRHQLLAEHFNVFSALGLDRRENYHSRFLAYLLNTHSDHAQGVFFLERFLHLLWAKNSNLPRSFIVHEGASRVQTEQFADDHGRIDLVIYLANHVVVAIENKIDHWEGEHQLPRYRNWLNSLRPNGRPTFLVFLTPDGRESDSPKDRADAHVDLCIGYGDLVKWLNTCILELPITAVRLTTVLSQYQQLCKTIAGELDMKSLKDEILTLIRQPVNLMAALEIAQHVNFEKELIRKAFRKNIESELKRLLGEAGITDWLAMDGKNGVLGVCFRTHINDKCSNFTCGIEKLFAGGYFGWCRPKCVDPKVLSNIDTASLSRQMQEVGFREPNGWWVGFTSLDNPFDDWQDEVIVAIASDNRQAEHALAKQLAQQVWNVFATYRAEIEALPSFKQAAQLA